MLFVLSFYDSINLPIEILRYVEVEECEK